MVWTADTEPVVVLLHHDYETDAGVFYYGTHTRAPARPYDGVWHGRGIEGTTGGTGGQLFDAITVPSGKRLRVTFWAYRSGIGNTRLDVSVIYNGVTTVEVAADWRPPVDTWTQFSVEFNVPAGATSMEVLIDTDHSGVTVDDDTWDFDILRVLSIPWDAEAENTSTHTPPADPSSAFLDDPENTSPYTPDPN